MIKAESLSAAIALSVFAAAPSAVAQAQVTAAPELIEAAPSPSARFFPGFKPFRVRTSSGIEISGVVGGNGPPVLLIHGAPVNFASWRKMAPALAEKYTVVATDLRGYGDSDMPEGGEGHANYAKRVMAQDQVDVMTALGFDRFHVVGHDRGGRVGHRLAIDHGDRVITLTVMDIMPTLYLYENVDRRFAEAYWFWFFLTAPAPVPETMVAGNPEFFMTSSFFGKRDLVEDDAFNNFVRTMSREGAPHAQSEDYRAASSIDLEHDRADLDQKLTMPLLVLWGDENALNKGVDIVGIWKERADDVRGNGVPSGHWLPEEAPDQLVEEAGTFIDAHN
jgi:haloacetate dehalogenase